MEGFTEISRIREFRGEVSPGQYIGLLVNELRQSYGCMQAYARIVGEDKLILTHEISSSVTSMKTIDDFLGILARLVDHDLELLTELAEYAAELDQR